MAFINKHMQDFVWDVIIRSCPNFNGGLFNTPYLSLWPHPGPVNITTPFGLAWGCGEMQMSLVKWLPPWRKGRTTCLWIKSVFNCLTIGIIHETMVVHMNWVWTFFNNYIYIYICWFNFDALAQGNAYKPTKEPINYRGPGGDRTHDLQTEATPPAASCPARTLHATEIAPKTQLQWHARGCTGQLTTRLECTGVNFNTCVC